MQILRSQALAGRLPQNRGYRRATGQPVPVGNKAAPLFASPWERQRPGPGGPLPGKLLVVRRGTGRAVGARLPCLGAPCHDAGAASRRPAAPSWPQRPTLDACKTMYYNAVRRLVKAVDVEGHTIVDFFWDSRPGKNVEHIQPKRISTREVEEVLEGGPLVLGPIETDGDNPGYLVIGPTAQGRLLLVWGIVFLNEPYAGFWYNITARDAEDEDRARYEEERGGRS